MRKRSRKGGLSPFKAGLLAIIAICVFIYLGFTKFANPFASPYTVHAVFTNANGLKPGSLVRIAGINVGKVQSVGPVPDCKIGGTPQKTVAGGSQQCSAADVTMTIDNSGLPIHKDATFAIRPRIFLEGNFFVDVSPGTPEAPVAPDDYTFPIQQGTEPVQFDQVLTSLQSNTRQNLQTLLQQFGTALKKGGPSFNASIKYWLPAYEYSAIVAHDALGIEPHDLSNAINDQGTVSGAIDTHPQNLQNLITNFNTTADAFARENVSLEKAVAALPKTLEAAIPAFNALNSAFCSGPESARLRARAAAAARQSADPGGQVDRPNDRREPSVHHPAALSGLALGAAGPDRRSVGDRAGAVEPDPREHPADGQRRPAGVELRLERRDPVDEADDQRSELQRLERIPVSAGVRRGGRFPPRPGGRVARLRRQRPVRPDPRDRRHAHLLAPARPARSVARAAPGRAAAAASGREVAAA